MFNAKFTLELYNTMGISTAISKVDSLVLACPQASDGRIHLETLADWLLDAEGGAEDGEMRSGGRTRWRQQLRVRA